MAKVLFYDNPNSESFLTFQERLDSLRECPCRTTMPDIDVMARCGFRYIGELTADEVACVCCGVHLAQWQSWMSPWRRHVIGGRIPCSFIKTNKTDSEIIRMTMEPITYLLPVNDLVARNLYAPITDASKLTNHLKDRSDHNAPFPGQLYRMGADQIGGDDREPRDKTLCTRCCAKSCTVVLMNCGHVGTCDTCYYKVGTKCCVCNTPMWLSASLVSNGGFQLNVPTHLRDKSLWAAIQKRGTYDDDDDPDIGAHPGLG